MSDVHPKFYRVVKGGGGVPRGGGSLMFPKVPQSSLGILRVPQLPPPWTPPTKIGSISWAKDGSQLEEMSSILDAQLINGEVLSATAAPVRVELEEMLQEQLVQLEEKMITSNSFTLEVLKT